MGRDFIFYVKINKNIVKKGVEFLISVGWNLMALTNIIPILALIIGIIFLVSLFFQWLWNITIPQVFGLKEITYWQAFRLLIIAGILFGGVHFR